MKLLKKVLLGLSMVFLLMALGFASVAHAKGAPIEFGSPAGTILAVEGGVAALCALLGVFL